MSHNAANSLDLARTMQETCIDRVHFFDTVESTNTTALDWARANEPAGVELFFAEQQTGGRGRGANAWWSAPGALTFSLLTPPLDLPAEQLPRISLTIGLAICKTVERFAERAGVALKWPNDVYLADRKVSGILIEVAANSRMVLGVGLNVNNSMRDAPKELRSTAITLRQVLHDSEPLDRTDVLIECLVQIEQQLNRLTKSDGSLPNDWRDYSLLTGRQVRIETPGHEIEGLCESIADDGALLVRTDENLQPCYGGVVTHWSNEREIGERGA